MGSVSTRDVFPVTPNSSDEQLLLSPHFHTVGAHPQIFMATGVERKMDDFQIKTVSVLHKKTGAGLR